MSDPRKTASDWINTEQENNHLRARVAELEAGMLDLANRVMPKMRARVAELEGSLKTIAEGRAGDVPSRFARAVLTKGRAG